MTQADDLAGVVLEGEFERDLRVEVLIDTDATDHGGEAELLVRNKLPASAKNAVFSPASGGMNGIAVCSSACSFWWSFHHALDE